MRFKASSKNKFKIIKILLHNAQNGWIKYFWHFFLPPRDQKVGHVGGSWLFITANDDHNIIWCNNESRTKRQMTRVIIFQMIQKL